MLFYVPSTTQKSLAKMNDAQDSKTETNVQESNLTLDDTYPLSNMKCK